MRNNSYVGIIVLMVFIVALFSYGSLGFDDITGQASVKIAEMQKMKVGESLAASTAKRGSAKTQFCEDDAKKAYKEKKLTKEDYYKMLERCKSERSTLAMPSPPPVESENYAATAVTCTETDGGLDYYLQGTVTVPAALPPSSSDTCYSGTGLYEFYCPTAGMQGPVARRDFDCASVGMVCQSGACVASAVPLTPETVDLSGDDLYYDMAIGDTTPVLTGSDLNLLADQTFVENMGPTPNTVDYVQELYFGPTISYSWGTTSSDRFTFTQDDRDFAVADSAIFLDNSLNPPNNFVYKYLFDFDGYVSYTPGSAAADLVGSSLTLLGDVYQIKTVIESGGLITSLTLDNGVDKYILPHGNVVTKNGNGLVNTEVSLSSSSGTLSSIAIWVGMGTDEVYLAAGDSYSDELFGKFDINFNNIEGGTFQLFEYMLGSSSGEIRFKNPDGQQVEIPMSADQSYIAGDFSDEPVFLGDDAPSSTVTNVDELVYLNGESCQGATDVTDCVGAQFLVQDTNDNVHLIRITDIDTVDDEVDFDDLTYGLSADDLPYVDSTNAATSFSEFSADFGLLIDEASNLVNFKGIVADGYVLPLANGATLEVVNNDLSTQIYEPWKYSDPVSSLGPTDMEMIVEYDDDVDNTMEITYFTTNVGGELDTSDGMGWYDETDYNDDFIKFMTYYGTEMTYDREDHQSMILDVPAERVYAQVELVTTP